MEPKKGTIEKAACEKCNKFVDAKWSYGSLDLEGVTLNYALRATCLECGEVVATSSQVAALFQIQNKCC